MMGSLGYAKCHWCKTEGWNFYIPDGVGGPLCGKCLLEEWEDKSTEHTNAASLDREHWVHQAIQPPDREYWKKPYSADQK